MRSSCSVSADRSSVNVVSNAALSMAFASANAGSERSSNSPLAWRIMTSTVDVERLSISASESKAARRLRAGLRLVGDWVGRSRDHSGR